jgi:hypothetical protein
MLCHRLLRPIADTHTVGEGTDIDTVIDRAGRRRSRAPVEPSSARQYVPLILIAQPLRSAPPRACENPPPITHS